MKGVRILRNPGCRMCGGTEFRTVLRMGRHALVNNLLDAADLGREEPAFPLTVKQCQSCFLAQLREVVDSSAIYREQDYPYFSSDMPKLSEYYAVLAERLKREFLRPGDLFVEIGSNDGIMLDLVRDGARVLGVDPSTNVVLRALRKGLATVPLFFTERLARQIAFEWGPARVVMGANVLAHLNDVHEVMRGVRALLADDGVAVFEFNYWGAMVARTDYSVIYHDHFSYYTAQNWADYAPRFGLELFDAEFTGAQGVNFRVYLGRGRPRTERAAAMLEQERRDGLNTLATAQRFGRAAHREARKLGERIRGLVAEGRRVAGYGAAAKGFSVLKLAGIDQRQIEYFVDDSPAKQGKYTPVTHIPILSRAQAQARLPDYFLITAPNYEEHILAKEGAYRAGGGKFITVDSRVV